jgi:hypothetical protein
MIGSNNNKDKHVNGKDSSKTPTTTNNNNSTTTSAVVASRVDLEDLENIADIRAKSRY